MGATFVSDAGNDNHADSNRGLGKPILKPIRGTSHVDGKVEVPGLPVTSLVEAPKTLRKLPASRRMLKACNMNPQNPKPQNSSLNPKPGDPVALNPKPKQLCQDRPAARKRMLVSPAGDGHTQ